MKAYLVYTTTNCKEVEIPDKFAPLAENNLLPDELWNELDEYSCTAEFCKLCEGIDGDLCALETKDGNILLEW